MRKGRFVVALGLVILTMKTGSFGVLEPIALDLGALRYVVPGGAAVGERSASWLGFVRYGAVDGSRELDARVATLVERFNAVRSSARRDGDSLTVGKAFLMPDRVAGEEAGTRGDQAAQEVLGFVEARGDLIVALGAAEASRRVAILRIALTAARDVNSVSEDGVGILVTPSPILAIEAPQLDGAVSGEPNNAFPADSIAESESGAAANGSAPSTAVSTAPEQPEQPEQPTAAPAAPEEPAAALVVGEPPTAAPARAAPARTGPTSTPVPSATSTRVPPTATWTAEPSETSSQTPTETPIETPTERATLITVASKTPEASRTGTAALPDLPTFTPSLTVTRAPSLTAVVLPTLAATPTSIPTPAPTVVPAASATWTSVITPTIVPTFTPVPAPTLAPVRVVTRVLLGDWMTDGDLTVEIEVDGVTIAMLGSGEAFDGRGWELNPDGFMVLGAAYSGTGFVLGVPEGIESIRLGIGDMDVNHLERLYDFSVEPMVDGRLSIEDGSVLGRNQNARGVMIWDNLVGDVTFVVELDRGKVLFEYVEIVRLHEQ